VSLGVDPEEPGPLGRDDSARDEPVKRHGLDRKDVLRGPRGDVVTSEVGLRDIEPDLPFPFAGRNLEGCTRSSARWRSR
jgi:hypothetical protein